MALDFKTTQRIQKEVTLGLIPNVPDTPEMKGYRDKLRTEFLAAKTAVREFSTVNDWDDS